MKSLGLRLAVNDRVNNGAGTRQWSGNEAFLVRDACVRWQGHTSCRLRMPSWPLLPCMHAKHRLLTRNASPSLSESNQHKYGRVYSWVGSCRFPEHHVCITRNEACYVCNLVYSAKTKNTPGISRQYYAKSNRILIRPTTHIQFAM